MDGKTALIGRIEHESQAPDFWADNRAAKAKPATCGDAIDVPLSAR